MSDKPAFPLSGFFPKDFDYSGQVITSHLAATQTYAGSNRKLLFEEISAGVPVFFDGLAYERIFAPSLLRSLFIADDIVERIQKCSTEVIGGQVDQLSGECEAFQPLVEANCHASFTILGALVADPSSSGRIHFGLGGDPIVNVNYLSTKDDIEALGATIRTGFQIMTSISGPSVLQRPCEVDDAACEMSCPDLAKELEGELGGIVGLLLPSYPASTIFPFSVEAHVNAHSSSNFTLGTSELFSIFSPHHFAGTARVGSVLDKNFQVLGTENLYVADASALPKTPRVNSMATSMMIGRLAGKVAMNEDW